MARCLTRDSDGLEMDSTWTLHDSRRCHLTPKVSRRHWKRALRTGNGNGPWATWPKRYQRFLNQFLLERCLAHVVHCNAVYKQVEAALRNWCSRCRCMAGMVGMVGMVDIMMGPSVLSAFDSVRMDRTQVSLWRQPMITSVVVFGRSCFFRWNRQPTHRWSALTQQPNSSLALVNTSKETAEIYSRSVRTCQNEANMVAMQNCACTYTILHTHIQQRYSIVTCTCLLQFYAC